MFLAVSSQGVLPSPPSPVVSQTCYSHLTGLNSPGHSAPHSLDCRSVSGFGVGTSRIL